MKSLFYMLFVLEYCFISYCEGESTYYVKPTPDTECPGQPCETLQYYLDNINTSNRSSPRVVNVDYDDITVIFLNGTHGINTSIESSVNIILSQSTLRIIGQENVTIQCLWLPYVCPLVFSLEYSDLYIDGLTSIFALYIGIIDYFDAPGFLSLSSVTLHWTKFEIEVIQAYFDHLVVTRTPKLSLFHSWKRY